MAWAAPIVGAFTAQMLIDAIVAAGGPTYVYVEIAPATPNSTGGEPGGNIRNGYFYNPDRVSLVEGGLALITPGVRGHPPAAGRHLQLQRPGGDADQRPLPHGSAAIPPGARSSRPPTLATPRAPPRPRPSAPMSTTRWRPIRR